MTDTDLNTDLQDLVVDEVFPHTPETIWKTLTDGDLMGRWIMAPKGFAAVTGTHFTFQTEPDGPYDGLIRCQVLEARPNERLVYTWTSRYQADTGYVTRLDTVVSWTLTPVEGGTRLRLIHSGFVTPRNDGSHAAMGRGWPVVIGKLVALAAAADT